MKENNKLLVAVMEKTRYAGASSEFKQLSTTISQRIWHNLFLQFLETEQACCGTIDRSFYANSFDHQTFG